MLMKMASLVRLAHTGGSSKLQKAAAPMPSFESNFLFESKRCIYSKL